MKKLDLALILGGAIGSALIIRSLYLDEKAFNRPSTPPAPLPPTPVAPPLPSPGPSPVPGPQPPAPTPIPIVAAHVISGPLVAENGRLYRATVDISAPASWIADTDKVHNQAIKAGFTDVSVQKGRKPAGWPGSQSGDYYVTGIYSGSQKTMARSYLGGEVSIVEVWEG